VKRTLVLLASLCAFGAEGKWTPDQILQIGPAALKRLGLALPPERLWNPATGQGLLSAVINTGGCSGAFVSSAGLFVTNHHCLFGIVQQHSTTANDLITNGFLARSQSEELRGQSVRVTVPHRFTDVTAEVIAAVPAGAGDLARHRAIERKQNDLVAACEKQPAHRCRAAAFDGGVRYVLVDTIEYSDVRLVYAPPRSIGEFGGEIDNFAWPRHTGDFAIGRVYADGVPYRPAFHLPISSSGVKPGDFVMVMGYPGTTYRSLTAAEVAERRDLYFTRRVDLYGEWIRILEECAKDSPAAAIAVAAHLKSLNNSFKNASGQLEGFARGRILEKREAADRAVLDWAAGRPNQRAAIEAYDGLGRLVEEQKQTWERDHLLAAVPQGAKALYLAATLARASLERAKPDPERDPQFMDRELPRLRDRLDREQSNIYVPADKKLFASFLRRRGASSDRIESMYAATRVLDAAERRTMFDQTAEQLRARRDPMLDFGFEIAFEQQALRERQNRWAGAVSRLRPVWMQAVMAHAGKPIAPDANGTLRVSFAHVQGYEPREAVIYKPQTSLSGMLQKVTGKDPFQAPAEVVEAARARNFGPWADPRLNDIPVDFLSNADTTGGNSGSPTVNARGELVGVNFDRVWENVANDFGYNPAIARNVNVDIRYLLWMLDRVNNGGALLKELGF
jgi:hypothetical protein